VSLDDLSRFAGVSQSANVHRVLLMDEKMLEEIGLEHADGAPLSLANREEYVRWAVFEQLFGARWKAMCAIWRGYHHRSAHALHAAMEALFVDELPLLLGGAHSSSVRMRDLLAIEGVVQFGSAVSMPRDLERSLRAALETLSSLETRQVLQFMTGSDGVPFRPRQGFLRFVYSQNGPRNGMFVAHTCFNMVDVCPFDAAQVTPEILRAKLLQSMELGGGRFDLL
jgi:hypothetical protein